MTEPFKVTLRTPILNKLEQKLHKFQHRAMIITEQSSDIRLAKRFVEQVLGKPQSAMPWKWVFKDGRTVYFDFDGIWIDEKLRGFDGLVIWFTGQACDELLGIQR